MTSVAPEQARCLHPTSLCSLTSRARTMRRSHRTPANKSPVGDLDNAEPNSRPQACLSPSDCRFYSLGRPFGPALLLHGHSTAARLCIRQLYTAGVVCLLDRPPLAKTTDPRTHSRLREKPCDQASHWPGSSAAEGYRSRSLCTHLVEPHGHSSKPPGLSICH